MKYIFSLLFLIIFVNASEKNIGFLMNQKYVCTMEGAVIGNKIEKIISTKDALKYPIRFYVDDNKVLHTDGKVNNIFYHNQDSKNYVSKRSQMNIKVINDVRFLMKIDLSGELKGIPLLYTCIETNNWTLR